jgi:hypothetical protein
MYRYVYIQTYIHTSIVTQTCGGGKYHVCAYTTCVCVSERDSMCACVGLYILTYIHTYIYIYVCVCVCVYIYIYPPIYIHIYMYIYTNIHTNDICILGETLRAEGEEMLAQNLKKKRGAGLAPMSQNLRSLVMPSLRELFCQGETPEGEEWREAGERKEGGERR